MQGENERNKRDRERESVSPDRRSPQQKRGKTKENMISWDDVSAEKELIQAAMVLNILEAKTENEKIKKLIDCYNPLIREETDEIKKYMMTCCEDWTNKEEILIEAITYVWPEGDLIKQDITEYDKLIDILIIAIETLMPKKCKECNQVYIVTDEDKPTIRCRLCQVGAHDCIDRGNKEKLRGMTWFCKKCNDILEKQVLPKIDLMKRMELTKQETELNFEGFERGKQNSKKIEKEKSKKITAHRKENTNDEIARSNSITNMEIEEREISDRLSVEINSDEQTNTDENNNQANGRNVNNHQRGNNNNGNDRGNNNISNSSNNRDSNNNNERINCWHYENRVCKFGTMCRNIHKEACKKWMEQGRCPDSRCKSIHPKKCILFSSFGHCPRTKCWYTHPTKMNIGNQQQYQNNNHQQNNTNNYMNNNGYSRQNQRQGFQGYQRNYQNFLAHWPTPMESTNLQQTLSRLIGTVEKVNARVENMEMNHWNRWGY